MRGVIFAILSKWLYSSFTSYELAGYCQAGVQVVEIVDHVVCLKSLQQFHFGNRNGNGMRRSLRCLDRIVSIHLPQRESCSA